MYCYIKNYTFIVIVDKHIRAYPNLKPWMTREVQRLLKERKLPSGLVSRPYSTAYANLKRCIKEAKSEYKRKFDKKKQKTSGQ